jgi:CheY-like chemotaxis protein
MPEPQAEPGPIVLVVEDEVLIRLATADHLRSCGFKVLESASGAEAQDLILAGPRVDLVFSDITMPGPVDGVALARWLHEQYPAVRASMHTAIGTCSRAGTAT